jgi:pimeloyl-ACP methyl ester carboxylesterase
MVHEWGHPVAPAVLYWDGLGGCGLHANELGPLLVDQFGLRVLAPDPPGHGASPARPPEAFRPSVLADLAAALLDELGLDRVLFVGFSWGGRVGCSFAERFPERTAALVLVDGGYVAPGDLGADLDADLDTCVAEARRELEEDSFDTWEAHFAFQRDSLGRWSPALEEAHRAMMREADGRVVPILEAESLGAIKLGGRREPVRVTYPGIAGAGMPVLLLTAPEPDVPEIAARAIKRFGEALPAARVEAMPDAVHDLVSHDPARVAELVGGVQPPP